MPWGVAGTDVTEQTADECVVLGLGQERGVTVSGGRRARVSPGVDQAFAFGYFSRFRYSHSAFQSIESAPYLLRVIEALVI